MLHWWRIFALELLSIVLVIGVLGYFKLPRFMQKKHILRGFPWGYYPDAVPRSDPGFYNENSTDFMHDVGTEFGGMEGFGDFGEFTGFGQLGEFGTGFGSGGDGG
jgi:hypothetical protein